MRRLCQGILGTVVMAMLSACGGDEPPPPDPAAETAQAQADSLARVRAETDDVRGMVARMINFDYNRAVVRPGADAQVLEQKAAILQANPNLRIEITGHCDVRGPAQYNMALGQRRADAAKRLLVQRGIAADRITVRSRGKAQPVDPGTTQAAHARNRRVEFAITAGGDVLRRPAP
jgi:peptidoglycan-associated lipoprotein